MASARYLLDTTVVSEPLRPTPNQLILLDPIPKAPSPERLFFPRRWLSHWSLTGFVEVVIALAARPLRVQVPESVLRVRDAQEAWLGGLPSPGIHPALLEIPGALIRASIDVLTPKEILERVATRWRNPDSSILIDRLADADLTKWQHRQLLSILANVMEASEVLPAKERVRADRLIYRLLFRVRDPSAFDFAMRCLQHPRTYVRKAGYRFFSTRGVPPAMAGTLIDHFHASMSQEPLQILARSPEAVAEVETASLLEALEDRYWRMRVIQGMLLLGKPLDQEVTSRYAIECIWACARQPGVADRTVMRRLLDENRREPEFVRWYIWALGKLGAKRELRAVRPIAEELLKSAGMSLQLD